MADESRKRYVTAFPGVLLLACTDCGALVSDSADLRMRHDEQHARWDAAQELVSEKESRLDYEQDYGEQPVHCSPDCPCVESDHG